MIDREKLARDFREIGFNRMGREADAGTYDNDLTKLIVDIRYAITLKSNNRNDIVNLGRILTDAQDGEYDAR